MESYELTALRRQKMFDYFYIKMYLQISVPFNESSLRSKILLYFIKQMNNMSIEMLFFKDAQLKELKVHFCSLN